MTRPRKATWIGALAAGWALVALFAQAAPISTATVKQPVSTVVYPEQDIPLRFSHVQHLTLADAPSCTDCHDRAAGSRSSLDNLMPGESACRPCHRIERQLPGHPPPTRESGVEPGDACATCHPGHDAAAGGAVARIRMPSPNIKFNHKLHVDATRLACTTCHGDLAADNVALATRDHLPKMDLCLRCHDGKKAPSRCVTCHLAGPGGVMRTEFDTGKLAPSGALFGAAHDLSFRTAHAAAAQNNDDYCGTCHRKRFCVDCHNGVAKPMDFHGNDYVTLHVIDARRDALDCSACHRSQTFCTGCHSRSGVSADQRGSEFASDNPARRFHPAGWVDGLGIRGVNHHSFEAQRNIRQCASCHREQFCIGCHSAEMGSLGANPHPAGWAQSRRCRALLARNARVCLRCHVSASPPRCQ